jgi:predicted ATPase
LLTIVGPGGIGKTSLAIELARSLAEGTADGAWLIPLDAVDDPAHVAAAIARTLGVYEGPERPVAEGVSRHLAELDTLLVLDNFEQVIDAAPFVSVLLRAAGRLRIVVTSRAPLRVDGEHEYALGPLEGGGGEAIARRPASGDGPAVRLFIERARAVSPSWDPGTATATIREICEHLDGLPLGIELAAARVALLPLTAIRDRLAARLPLPGGGRRDAPDRQRTLEGAIAWSVALLRDDQRTLLRRLAVFEGGFDLDQASEVAAGDGGAPIDVLDDVLELAEQSLLARVAIPDTGARLGGLRFRMLETIRTVALRDLDAAGETEPVRRRHAQAFLALAESAARQIPGGDQARWLDRLAEDQHNLPAAVTWSIEHGPVEWAQRLVAALWRYWQLSGRLREGRELVDRAVELGPDEPTPARMWAVMAAGSIAYWQADSERAHGMYREELELARQIGDIAGEADATFNLSATGFIVGDRTSSLDLVRQARALYEQAGDQVGADRTLWAEHNVLAYEGRIAEAMPLVYEAAKRYEANGDVMYQAQSAGSLSWMAMMAGDRATSITWGSRALASTHALRDVASTTLTVAAAAILLLEWERWAESATLFGAYEHLSDVYGLKPPAGLGYMIELFRPVDRTLEQLRADDYEEARAAGRQMTLDGAVAYALDVLDRIMAEEAGG